MTEAEHLHHTNQKNIFGFWVYLMTDLIIFAVLFATYAVLHGATASGPSSKDLFELPFALTETLILLTSSFTCGLGMLAVHAKKKGQVLTWFFITLILGISFLGMEIYEFNHFIHQGYDWGRSAFLSSFFALVGTHGLHISSGVLWMIILLIAVLTKGLTNGLSRKLMLLSLFWHFLDVVWIYIFTIVYLMGVI